MDPIFDIELQDCPICRGVGAMQDEQGWSVSVACMDCGPRRRTPSTARQRNVWSPRAAWRCCGTWARSCIPAPAIERLHMT